MLIASTLNNNSSGYSIVNKEFLASYLAWYNRDYLRCAVADIMNPESETAYILTHNLGTDNVIVNAYELSNNVPESIEISYSVPDASTIRVAFNKISKNTIRVIVTGAINCGDASVAVETEN